MERWRDVLAELVQQRRRNLVAYAVVLCGDPVEAEDLVQEALIASFGRGRRFDGAVAAEAYVRRAIASRFIDERRREQRHRRRVDAVAAVAAASSPGPETTVPDLTDLEMALQILSARERAVVVLRYLDQCSTREAAHVLGLSEGAVKRYLSDGLTRLNGLLGLDEDPIAPPGARVDVKEVTR